MGDPTVISYRRPEKVTKENASRAVGFMPVIPKSFPCGFRLQSMQTNDSRTWKSVVIRLTDGLARATVYQWLGNDNSGDVQSIENSTTINVGSIRVMLVSDLSPETRRRLLGAFLTRTEARLDSVPRSPSVRISGAKPIYADVLMIQTRRWA
jgi:hypothetical protein